MQNHLLLQTKLAPPRLQRHLLPRPALHARLLEALEHRLVLLHAGTGYGKTTALARLAEERLPLVWYSVEEADTDPQRFLSYLIAACRYCLPTLPDTPVAILEEGWGEGSREALTRALDALLNALATTLDRPALLVLDDYHFVAPVPDIQALLERFISYLPPQLHVILSSRYPLELPGLLRWRARGEILEIDRSHLAFEPAEIEALFHTSYGMTLSSEEIASLNRKTEGWPIALQLVWQRLRGGHGGSATELLAQSPSSLADLFDYLAADLFASQPPEIARFLRESAVLRELTAAACDAVTGRQDSAGLLDQLHEMDLFLVALGGGQYRYHHLFHDFLRQQAEDEPEENRERHRRAARFFTEKGNEEEAIHHWLAAGDDEQAAAAIERASEAVLRAGRLDTVILWIDALPVEIVAARPRLQAYLADVYRLQSRFEEALAWYRQAEQGWRGQSDAAGISRALRGQALVYLDTVRPAQAESLLEEALRLVDRVDDRHSRARLLELLAENKLNMGKPGEAERLRAEAHTLREEGPGEDVLSVRVKLRTGRLDEAQTILEEWAESERQEEEHGQVHQPRAHRETVLILSLVHAFRGEVDRAFNLASEGVALGERLGSPFITAVAQMRLGHAWQLRRARERQPDPQRPWDEAIRCYQNAVTLGDQLAVRRTRLEAMWGLTRAYGFRGELESARRTAGEGLEIGQWAGDQWVVSLVELALGASYVLAGEAAAAVELLSRVLVAFRDCGDQLGRAATRLWLSLAYLALEQEERFAACCEELLATCDSHRYDFLFTAPSLLGPPEPHRLVPVLLAARARRIRPAYVNRLLAEIGLPDVEFHPGYQLRVQTLGAFRLWRGDEMVEPREWQRDKARQLFQLLLTYPGNWMQREEIVERLWPELLPEAGVRHFKVALNALNRALEPERETDRPFAFIAREGTAYRLRPEADIWLDAALFEEGCRAGLQLMERGAIEPAIERLNEALQLYEGDYLPDALYEDWSSEARERFLSLYLRAADRLAGALLELKQYEACIDISQRILSHDPCWEQAYRFMMEAHFYQGHRHLAHRVYQRCVATLARELDMAPSAATLALHDRIWQAGEGSVTDL